MMGLAVVLVVICAVGAEADTGAVVYKGALSDGSRAGDRKRHPGRPGRKNRRDREEERACPP